MVKIEAEFFINDHDTEKVLIVLSDREHNEYKKLKGLFWMKYLFGRLDNCNPDLEEILCGHRPDRYIKI